MDSGTNIHNIDYSKFKWSFHRHLNNKTSEMTSDMANELSILSIPEHQNAEERAHDELRLQLLKRLQHIVKARKITNYEDFLQATKDVEKEMAEEKKRRMAKGIKKVKAAAGMEEKKSVVKKVKTEMMREKSAKDAFPVWSTATPVAPGHRGSNLD